MSLVELKLSCVPDLTEAGVQQLAGCATERSLRVLSLKVRVGNQTTGIVPHSYYPTALLLRLLHSKRAEREGWQGAGSARLPRLGS